LAISNRSETDKRKSKRARSQVVPEQILHRSDTLIPSGHGGFSLFGFKIGRPSIKSDFSLIQF
jgi:hypothetical protein